MLFLKCVIYWITDETLFDKIRQGVQFSAKKCMYITFEKLNITIIVAEPTRTQ